MLNNAETRIALQKTKPGSNTAISEIDNGVVDKVAHHSNYNNDRNYLVKPGSNRGITERKIPFHGWAL
ncbi:hypothetical protein PAFU01_04500 [Pantoea ananatis]|nr:hypothetical protein PAFU01_04500 [Pantoea ananatis]